MVLILYRGADFQEGEKPKGAPLEIEIFLVWREGQEPSKSLLRLFNQQKNKILKSALP